MTYADNEMRGARTLADFVGALNSGIPMSRAELAGITRLHDNTVQRYLKAFKDHKPYKLVHVAGWQDGPNGSGRTPLYAFGNRPDVPQPKLSKAERKERDKMLKRESRKRLAIINKDVRTPWPVDNQGA